MSPRRKKEITEEELFRSEILKKIQSKKKINRGEQLWKVLNSSFALWLLSSVILGAITFAYSRIQTRAESISRNEERMRELKLEISNRHQNASTALADFDRRKNERPLQIKQVNSFLLSIVLQYLNRSNEDYVFEKLKDRNYRSLLMELSTLVDDEERKRINSVITEFNKLKAEVTATAIDTTLNFQQALDRSTLLLKSVTVE